MINYPNVTFGRFSESNIGMNFLIPLRMLLQGQSPRGAHTFHFSTT